MSVYSFEMIKSYLLFISFSIFSLHSSKFGSGSIVRNTIVHNTIDKNYFRKETKYFWKESFFGGLGGYIVTAGLGKIKLFGGYLT